MPTTITAVRVFDGTDLIAATAVRVDGDRIAAVGGPQMARPGDRVVDGRGGTLLPGLIDAHVHLLPGALEQALVFGVTTVIDQFSKPDLVAALRRRAGADPALADLRSATVGATAPGGHPSMMYAPIPYATGPDQAAAFVAARAAEGADHLKVISDLGADTPFPNPTLDPATIAALAAAAHDRGLRVVAHATTRAAARAVVAAGVDGLEHVPTEGPLDEPFVALAAARGVTLTPTLATIEGFLGRDGGARVAADPDLAPFLGEPWRAGLIAGPHRWPGGDRRDYGVVRENVARLAAAGVPVLAGTDAPNPGTVHGASLHRELELLVDAGLTPLAALRAATSEPARAYGLTDRGAIAPGLRADLVLVDGDPTAAITATRRIAAIWRGGRAADRDAYAGGAAERAQLDALRAQVERVTAAVREWTGSGGAAFGLTSSDRPE